MTSASISVTAAHASRTRLSARLAMISLAALQLGLASPLIAQIVPNKIPETAAEWEVECSSGKAISCRIAGNLHYGGLGVAQDRARAIPLFERACDLGESLGCFSAGSGYAEGDGVATDVVKAVRLFERGCDLQLSLSCVHAGQSYRDGLGVEKDRKTAKLFFIRAIDIDPDFPVAKKALSTVK